MALVLENNKVGTSWFQRLCSRVLKYGPLPRHVAFIMDGNRRFARKKHVERIEGHSKGFDKLAETLWWCEDLGIEEVTVYAFSAENFKRSQSEVDSLMELARNKFEKIKNEREALAEHGVQIRIIGEIHLLPKDIQQLAGQLEVMTRGNKKCRLNICVAYTSRLEMTGAVRNAAWGVETGLIQPDDVTESLINKTLEVSEVDLLIRTSGEVRLSDFLLWQTSFSYLSFIKPLWPEFSIWDFYGIIVQFQRKHPEIMKCKEKAKLDMLEEDKLLDLDNKGDFPTLSVNPPGESPTSYNQLCRKQRVDNFLTALKEKRTNYYNDLANCE